MPTVVWPFALGALAALIALIAASRREVVLALLLPMAALVAYILLEGTPIFPPVAAKQKLPFLLAFVGVTSAFAAAKGQGPFGRIAFAVLATVVSIGWIGQTVVLGQLTSTKAHFAEVFGVVGLLGLISAAASANANAPASVMTAAACLWWAVAAAIASVLAPYVGAAQVLGAWAAILGGFLFVGYLAGLFGRADGMALQGFAGLAAVWTTLLLALMPLLFAGEISRSSIVIGALAPIFAAFAQARGWTGPNGAPAPMRPILLGLVAAVPAFIAAAAAGMRWT